MEEVGSVPLPWEDPAPVLVLVLLLVLMVVPVLVLVLVLVLVPAAPPPAVSSRWTLLVASTQSIRALREAKRWRCVMCDAYRNHSIAVRSHPMK